MHSRSLVFLTVLAFNLYLLGLPAWAQMSDVTSSIAGTVRDSSGAAINGAVVDAVARDTGFVRTVQTRDDGSFTVPLLTV